MEFQLDHRDHSGIFDGSAELIGLTDKHYLTSNIYLAIHSTNSSDLSVLRMKRKRQFLLSFYSPSLKHSFRSNKYSDSPVNL